LENLKVIHDLSHRWQWQEIKGEGDALSHIAFLLIWGCLGTRKNLCSDDQFSLVSLSVWGIKPQGFKKHPPLPAY
jgi:hypothetical protein